MLKFTIRYKKRWAPPHIEMQQPQKITNISFGRGDGCLLFVEVTCRLKRREKPGSTGLWEEYQACV